MMLLWLIVFIIIKNVSTNLRITVTNCTIIKPTLILYLDTQPILVIFKVINFFVNEVFLKIVFVELKVLFTIED